MLHTIRSRSMISLLLVFIFLLVGCGQSNGQSNDINSLKELPHEEALKLQPALEGKVLGTQILSTPPPESLTAEAGLPAVPCAADYTIDFYTANVTTPIVICTQEEYNMIASESAYFPQGVTTTSYKLTDPEIFKILKDGVLWQPPLSCKASNGPWPAELSAERGCSGTCRPSNVLVVTGYVWQVKFTWYGSFDEHPDGFEFVDNPVHTGHNDPASCTNVPTRDPRP